MSVCGKKYRHITLLLENPDTFSSVEVIFGYVLQDLLVYKRVPLVIDSESLNQDVPSPRKKNDQKDGCPGFTLDYRSNNTDCGH